MTKPILQSKTFWFNVLALLVLVLPIVQAWAGATSLVLPLWVSEVLALLIPVVNVVLRFVTRGPVHLPGQRTEL